MRLKNWLKSKLLSKSSREVLADTRIIICHDFYPYSRDREEYTSSVGVFDAISACVDDLLQAKLICFE